MDFSIGSLFIAVFFLLFMSLNAKFAIVIWVSTNYELVKAVIRWFWIEIFCISVMTVSRYIELKSSETGVIYLDELLPKSNYLFLLFSFVFFAFVLIMRDYKDKCLGNFLRNGGD